LKETKSEVVVTSVGVKIDPGSKVTGIALVGPMGKVLFAAELEHRGSAIKARLEARRAVRRNRRRRKTRYRKARFLNRTKPKGWLAPSLMHRVLTILTWVKKFQRLCSVVSISVERVKFDIQAMQNPEISGVEYQQGTLQGYTVKEYLLEKWNWTCAYCGAKNVPFEVEHIVPKVHGGSNRISNLALACHDCNERKGKLPVEVFLKDKPDVLKRITAQAKRPLKDAASVNSTRNALLATLVKTGLPVETGTGIQTQLNRKQQNYPKAHWIDAACVGNSGSASILDPATQPLRIKAVGHGSRQMCRTNRFGFPKQHKTRQAAHFGFRTGDIVKAVIAKGKFAGSYIARVSVRAKGCFNLSGVGSTNYRNCTVIHRQDGYAYN
jgi:5-methylcytosine-specific restriction endonuclease McrA